MIIRASFFSGLLAGLIASQAFALDALVEAADPLTGLKAFDFLKAGDRVELGASGKLVIGYPSSCLREQIVGGTVVVGVGESAVDGGKVSREHLQCDGGALLARNERQESGATAFRMTESQPEIMIYTLTPVLLFPAPPDALVIERIDAPGRSRLFRNLGRQIDFAARGVELHPGGVYRVNAGNVSVDLMIDKWAKATDGPPLTRLVRF